MSSQSTPQTESEEYAYGHVLEALSGGLYPNKLDVLREYLQNSYDAIRKYGEEGGNTQDCRVDVIVSGRSIVIHDNAGGMDRETINEYRKIGFSKKPYGAYAGWRGIGKAAGFAVANKVVVTSAQSNSDEGHQLIFRASDMLNEVRQLRAKGLNISFGRLIQQFSAIETVPKQRSEHYTSVNLDAIRPEVPELLDPDSLYAHLSQIAPVPFNPSFKYAPKIEQHLREHIEDYMPLKVFVGNKQVYKPYLDRWTYNDEETRIKEPEFLPIYSRDQDLIATSWYCMNDGKGQIRNPVSLGKTPVDVSGPVYRVRDIRIGDAQLSRRTLWRTTPERAFYAVGEIHVLDPRLEPTADRNDFVDNLARFEFYEESFVLAKEISSKAGKQSAELRAESKILEANNEIRQIASDLGSGKVTRELVPLYIYKAIKASDEALRRTPFAKREELKQSANLVIEQSAQLVEQLRASLEIRSEKEPLPPKLTDITEELGFSEETRRAYYSVMKALGDFFVDYPDFYEELVKKIHLELRRSFEPQGR